MLNELNKKKWQLKNYYQQSYGNAPNQLNMDEKTRRILNHIQTIAVLTDCIDIEYNSDMVDAKFKDKALNNHNRRIKESISQIKKSLAFRYKVKDREFMTYEHAVQVHRLFAYFSSMDTSQLEELMDGFEKLK